MMIGSINLPRIHTTTAVYNCSNIGFDTEMRQTG